MGVRLGNFVPSYSGVTKACSTKTTSNLEPLRMSLCEVLIVSGHSTVKNSPDNREKTVRGSVRMLKRKNINGG